MVNFTGVTVCLCVSLWCAPITNYIMEHKVLSNVLPMYIMQYSMFLTAFAVFMCILKPTQSFGSAEKRGGVFYFMCCMFTCIAVSQLAVHCRRFAVFGKAKTLKYFARDEPYLKTPFGMSSELSHCVVTYIMSLLMVFQMDNNSSPRDLALYWCGFTVTKTLVTGLSLLSGPFVTKLRYNSLVNLFFFAVCLWLLLYFLVSNPRSVPCYKCFAKCNTFIDTAIVLLLAFSAVFNFVRILGALNSNQKHVKYYTRLEPYIKHKSKFGSSWILICGFFSIPCCLFGILSLCRSLTKRSLNMALLHAGGILQGTFVYLSYNWFIKADKKGKIPIKYYYVVTGLNLLIVAAAHAYLIRCLWKHVPLQQTCCPRRFDHTEKKKKKRVRYKQRKEEEEEEEENEEEEEEDDDSNDYCYDRNIACEEENEEDDYDDDDNDSDECLAKKRV